MFVVYQESFPRQQTGRTTHRTARQQVGKRLRLAKDTSISRIEVVEYSPCVFDALLHRIHNVFGLLFGFCLIEIHSSRIIGFTRIDDLSAESITFSEERLLKQDP
jgi:hypothetical protein